MMPTAHGATFWHSVGLWQNDFLMVLDAILMTIFAASVAARLRDLPLRWSSLTYEPIKVRWALGLLFVSRSADRFADFLSARNLDTAEAHKLIDSAALFLAVWSALCLVRIFADAAWGRKAWLWATAIAALGSAILDYFFV